MTVLHRPPNQPYLVLLKDTLEVEEDTLNRSARELRNPQLQSYLEGENKPNIGTLLSIYNEGKENSGLTSAEYFVFQKDFLIRHGVHPDTTNGTILLSTERRYNSEPNELPVATWNKNDHRIHLFSQSKMSSSSTIGTRFTKIYKISS